MTIVDRWSTGNDIGLVLLVSLCSVLLIVLVYAIVYALNIKKNPMHTALYMTNNTKEWRRYCNLFRGSDYYVISANRASEKELIKKDAPQAAITCWSISHIILYAILGFIAPKCIAEIFVLGVLFEAFESTIKCHCMLDLCWNGLGLVFGCMLRSIISPC